MSNSYNTNDDFIKKVTQMVYKNYEANKTIIDYLARKPLICGGPSSIQTKNLLL